MNIVLDTHAYLWFIEGSERLSMKARVAIENPGNRKFISAASLWEITVKYGLGKLLLKSGLKPILTEFVEKNGFDILPIESSHLLKLCDLPMHHRDPFDRLIIAQCLSENFALCSVDGKFKAYDVELVW